MDWGFLDQVVVISLREATARRAAAAAQLARAGLPAERVHWFLADRDPDGDRRGCFNSHQRVARRCLERGWTRALVLEDNAVWQAPAAPAVVVSAVGEFVAAADCRAAILFLGHFLVPVDAIRQTRWPPVHAVGRLAHLHAYIPSPAAMRLMATLPWRGEQMDSEVGGLLRGRQLVERHAVVPMLFTQAAGESGLTPLHNLLRGTVRTLERLCRHWLRLPLLLIVLAAIALF